MGSAGWSATRGAVPLRRVAVLSRLTLAVARLDLLFRVGLAGVVLAWYGWSHAWDSDRLVLAAAPLGPRVMELTRALRGTINDASALNEGERLVIVNQFFNREILFRSDADIWGMPDYWASPLEVLAKEAGDCEDFAMAKYFSLVASGIASAKLRMVYVRASVGGVQQTHMVVAYYPVPDTEPYILDNLVSEIRPASRRPDLTPVFSFNAEGLWQGTSGPGAGDPTVRLSRWREVLMKAHEQGFL